LAALPLTIEQGLSILIGGRLGFLKESIILCALANQKSILAIDICEPPENQIQILANFGEKMEGSIPLSTYSNDDVALLVERKKDRFISLNAYLFWEQIFRFNSNSVHPPHSILDFSFEWIIPKEESQWCSAHHLNAHSLREAENVIEAIMDTLVRFRPDFLNGFFQKSSANLIAEKSSFVEKELVWGDPIPKLDWGDIDIAESGKVSPFSSPRSAASAKKDFSSQHSLSESESNDLKISTQADEFHFLGRENRFLSHKCKFTFSPEQIEKCLPIDGFHCSICLNAYQATDVIITLPCDHYFCKPCILNVISRLPLCPLCRSSIQPDSLRSHNPLEVFISRGSHDHPVEKTCTSVPYLFLNSLYDETSRIVLSAILSVDDLIRHRLIMRSQHMWSESSESVKETLFSSSFVNVGPIWDYIFTPTPSFSSVSSSTSTSSSKKPSSIPVCRYFQMGNCSFGKRCRYRHDCPEVSAEEVGKEQVVSEIQQAMDPLKMIVSPLEDTKIQYSAYEAILLIGEADLSFSLSLAITFAVLSKSSPRIHRLFSTTLESSSSLASLFPTYQANRMVLENFGHTVMCSVDVTSPNQNFSQVETMYFVDAKFQNIFFYRP
jgi:hypothetical protein